MPDPHFEQRDHRGKKTLVFIVSSYTFASTRAYKGISVINGAGSFGREQLSFEQSSPRTNLLITPLIQIQK